MTTSESRRLSRRRSPNCTHVIHKAAATGRLVNLAHTILCPRCESEVIPCDQTTKRVHTVRMSEALYKSIAKASKAEGISANAFLCRAAIRDSCGVILSVLNQPKSEGFYWFRIVGEKNVSICEVRDASRIHSIVFKYGSAAIGLAWAAPGLGWELLENEQKSVEFGHHIEVRHAMEAAK
mgnify:CR=1 FL=1